VAAIPATIAYNYIDKRVADLIDEVSASAEAWVDVLVQDPADGRAPQSAHGYQRR
jgi:biopolymer transport protein ExbB/TolQ